ncbi:MAG TPA: hypothetical protein VN193_04190 [Candidatus Angelobacter sp.]|jgi:hypothetical protein|nr:hypothetical protein [Candidatus Angelobacter sp.]
MARATIGFAMAMACASVTACGAAQTGGPVSTSPSASSTSTLSTSSTATPAPATVAPTPTATPIPPPPPLLIVQQYQPPKAVIEAIEISGTVHWSFDVKTVVGDGVQLQVAGSHLLLAGSGKIAVIDRSGTVIGRGTYSGNVAEVRLDPTGTRWAWSDSPTQPDSDGTVRGAVWVAGLSEPAHRIQDWTENGITESVVEWSDRGIVIAVRGSGCSPYIQEEWTALLDPATGHSTALFGHDRHLTDVHAGLETAVHGSSLFVTGRTTMTAARPSSEGLFTSATISPDGAHVFGSLVAAGGCGAPPHVRTAVGDVAAGSWTVLDNVFAVGWYDDSHLVVCDTSYEGPLHVVDLAGSGDPAALTHGYFAGVLR